MFWFFRSVFWSLFGAIYLCYGLPEVYRVLFEAFGMDPEDESCQPKLRRQLEDVDYVSVEFENRQLNWQDVAAYRAWNFAYFLFLCIIFNHSLSNSHMLLLFYLVFKVSAHSSCSLHKMHFLLILGFLEHVCRQACIGFGVISGTLIAGPRLWKHWDTLCQWLIEFQKSLRQGILNSALVFR